MALDAEPAIPQANQRWLIRYKVAEKCPLIEVAILEVSPSLAYFKVQVCSGPQLNAINVLTIAQWEFVELLSNDSEGNSNPTS
jgi:hypothetical protein